MAEGGDAPNGKDAAKGAEPARFVAARATLYVVATPLGNLRDLTFRAVDVLGSVDTIAAEDTRVTAVLLRHYGIAARPISLHEHNEAARAERIVEELRQGRSVALVSDAGTPTISDPGARLVRAVRDAGFAVVPIPGASAGIAAVSAAGLAAEHWLFLGFLPAAAKARRTLLASAAAVEAALIIYEAPHRVRATVEELRAALGGERSLVIAREITKKFETISVTTLAEAAQWLAADPNRERGEFVLLVDAPPQSVEAAGAATIDARRLLTALIDELPPARAARVAAALTGLPRDTLYAQAVELKAGHS
jgi:16S rRNA (cytidine1402-2'-O)-methyltransferase